MLHVRRLAASPLNGSAVLPFRFLPRERWLANSSGARKHMLSERLVRNIRSEQIILRVEVGAEHSE